jgi:hypothetical protein
LDEAFVVYWVVQYDEILDEAFVDHWVVKYDEILDEAFGCLLGCKI